MNFVFVSLQRINTDRDSTSTCLAKELAKNHQVLYVNSPIDRKTLLTADMDEPTQVHIEKVKRKEEPLVQLEENLWALYPVQIIESINWIPATPLFSLLNRLNNARFAKEIKSAVTRLQFQSFVLINDKDIFRSFYLKEYLKPQLYVYLDRDYTIGMDYWKKHGVSLEPKLMQKSDVVVCNSTDFTRRAKQYNPNSFYIGNGFDVEQYSRREPRPIPADLASVPEPRIGYVGALITLRLDLELMISLARERPQYSFVLIGWQDEAFAQSALHTLPNVYYLGKKHTKEVPLYLEHLDVCFNPQVLNEITIGNFPLKIVEYLALGKPVVATATNTMREVFSHYTYLAEDKASYLKQLKRALAEDSELKQEERIAFAQKFSWKNVVKVLLKSLNVIKEKKTVAACFIPEIVETTLLI